MIKQVEEIRPESQTLPFAQLECLVESEIHILLRRPNDAVARRVAIARSIARAAGRKRQERVRLVSQGIHPVGQPRLWTASARSVVATEPGVECGSRRRSAGQSIGAASRWIKNRERRARLQD